MPLLLFGNCQPGIEVSRILVMPHGQTLGASSKVGFWIWLANMKGIFVQLFCAFMVRIKQSVTNMIKVCFNSNVWNMKIRTSYKI